MRNTLLFLFVASIFFVSYVDARTYFPIDTFLGQQNPLVNLIRSNNSQPRQTYDWWTTDPTDYYYAGPPKARFHTTDDAIGGHRDVILGYEGVTAGGLVAIISLVNQRATVAFPLDYIGAAFFQWDGNDDPAGDTGLPADAFPGAMLNLLPGMGSGGVIAVAESSGPSVDFTSFGRAIGIALTIEADLDVNYFLDAIDANGNTNELPFAFTPPQGNEDATIRFFFRFTDARWTSLNSAGLPAVFDWTAVNAFQVRIYTFRGDESASIDTAFFNIGVVGYEVLGRVFIDCGCDSSPDTFVSGETFSLFLNSAPTVPIATATSDSNGEFSFDGLDDGTYIMCIDDTAQDICPQSSTCRTFTLANEIDPQRFDFSLEQANSLTPPTDITIQCGDCQTVACLGSATATNCVSGTFPVTTFTDSAITGTCTKTFRRTFTDGGFSVFQTVTIEDNDNPTVVTQASSISRNCDDTTTQTYQNWLSTSAGSQFDDCSALTFGNNAGAQNPGTCSSVTVTFSATDPCGASVSTTGTYTVIDNFGPTFTTPPADQQADCDIQGNSDINALNQWAASNAGAVASDNCSGASISNNFVQGSLQRGCSNSLPVTFTATDSCNNPTQRIATFTISDTQGPTITNAQNPIVECSATSTTAFNNWLAANGQATATDDCEDANNLNFSNDFTGTAPFGCDDSRSVVFTVTDSCGQSSSTTGVFTVRDRVGPTITTQASPLSTNCEANGSNALNDWLNDNGGARATDACTGVSFTNDFNSLSGDCTQVPVTFTACDNCGNACSTTTATYSIVDTDPPSYTTPPSNLSVQCGTDTQTAYRNWVDSNGNSVVADNCATEPELTLSNNAPQNAPTSGCPATVVVTFNARDPCGNSAPISTAQFSVTDLVAPVFTTFPSDMFVECAPASNNQEYQTWRSNNAGAVATDNCSSATFSNDGPNSVSIAAGSCSSRTIVNYTISDACGNQDVQSATFGIDDTTAPVMNTPASDASSECNSSAITAWLADNGGARASDACSSVTFSNNFSSLNGACTQTAFVTFTATDSCGLATDTSATYSVSDTTSPVINPRASPRSVPCDNQTGSELSAWLNDNGGARATDACQDDNDLTWSNNFNSAIIGCDFATVIFTVTDACGNTASTTSTFTSVDNDAPTFSPAAQPRTVECNGSGNVGDFENFVSTRAGAVAVDQCALSFTWTDNAPAAGPTSCGSQTVVFTVADECGNTASTSATYTVADTSAPSFSLLPTNRNVECDGSGNTTDKNNWISTNGGATATDVCATTVTFTQTRTDTTGDSCSTIDVYSFRAADNCGNTSTQTASYTIHDFTAPTFTTDPSNASFECDGNGNLGQITAWINDNGGARASDVCQGPVTWTNDFSGNGIFTCSSLLVGFTASDGCGNVVSRSATVSVEDTINPNFSFFPEDFTIPCDADASTDALGFATAVDQCAGDLIVSLSETEFDEPPNGDCPGDHIITRTFTTFDNCGNSITADQVITVVIARASGPCDPEGCECDGCCPPAAASDCLAVDCQAVACRATPCEASLCSCEGTTSKSASVEREFDFELPQCKPVYIYVNDDDDSIRDVDTTEIAKQRTFVTNEPIHESFLKSKSF